MSELRNSSLITHHWLPDVFELFLLPLAEAALAVVDLAELVHALEAIDVQDAVQGVDLVLQRLPEQALALDPHVAALAILRLDRHGPVALHVRHVAGDRQAAL